jgi:alpha/beta superfamily hydrolase
MPAASLLMDEDIFTESIRIPSPPGELAGELSYPLAAPRLACALFNPHPFMGGQMDNNIIRELSRTLPGHGAATLRFDYSGVGGSTGDLVNVAAAMLAFWETGTAPSDPRMIGDARAAAAWLARAFPGPLLLIGYSFGSHAAVEAIDDRVRGIVLISPTLRQHDFSALARSPLPKLVIQGENDFATPAAAVESWAASLPNAQSLRIQGGEHFFKRKELEVARACAAFARSLVEAEVAPCP